MGWGAVHRQAALCLAFVAAPRLHLTSTSTTRQLSAYNHSFLRTSSEPSLPRELLDLYCPCIESVSAPFSRIVPAEPPFESVTPHGCRLPRPHVFRVDGFGLLKSTITAPSLPGDSRLGGQHALQVEEKPAAAQHCKSTTCQEHRQSSHFSSKSPQACIAEPVTGEWSACRCRFEDWRHH